MTGIAIMAGRALLPPRYSAIDSTFTAQIGDGSEGGPNIMRKISCAFAALTALVGVAAAGSPAKALPAEPATAVFTLMQPVQYYGDPRFEAWRRERAEQEWRRREWERRREAEHWHHHDWDRW